MRDTEPELTIISLGAGVQSSVMALMAAHGLIRPLPDYAVFADTGWEPDGVYEHLNWLEAELPFEVVRTEGGNIRNDLVAGTNSTGQRFNSIPFHLRKLDGTRGIAKRQCTREYKLTPIHNKVRELLGLGYKERRPDGLYAELWLGISVDEVIRMKPSRESVIEHYWPLIDRGISRADCQAWFAEMYPGRVLPRSACIGCPYHTDAEWLHIKTTDPKSWMDAVAIDGFLRSSAQSGRFQGEVYLHPSLKPLAEVELVPNTNQLSLFGNECEGLCGV